MPRKSPAKRARSDAARPSARARSSAPPIFAGTAEGEAGTAPARTEADAAPASGVAARLAQLSKGKSTLLHIAATEARAEDTAQALRCFAAEAELLVLPAWDCLHYDRASPSRDSMGRRMAVLRALIRKPDRPRIVVTSVEAALQRVPPREVVAETAFELVPGEPFDRDAFERFVRRAGYLVDDRIDEPGEVAFRGETIEVFPPDRAMPVRLVLDGARIEEIRVYHPLTQRTADATGAISIGAASELVADREDGERSPGAEHRLEAHYGRLDTLFDFAEGCRLSMEPEAERRLEQVLAHIDDAYAAARDFGAQGETTPAPARLYLDAEEWSAALNTRKPAGLALDGLAHVPRFALEAEPRRALGRFVAEQLEAGFRVVIAGSAADLSRLGRSLKRSTGREPAAVESWQEALAGKPGTLLGIASEPGAGFVDEEARLALVSASDVFGAEAAKQRAHGPAGLLAEPDLRVGDVVIHEDHGIAVLTALERVQIDGEARDTIRLEYHGGASLLVPVEEFGKVWRYGSERDAVTLDRLNSDAWSKRRVKVSAEIDAAAAGLVELAKARMEETAQPIMPPRAAYARFAARFPYPETPDQAAAIQAVLGDLASGRAMNRVVCGDVGFGKTEIALRAAAAAALSGRQAAVVAPTTVLARQHLDTFERRFAGSGVKVAHLSRLLSAAEAGAVKDGLASGAIDIVVGTHAIGSEGVAFTDLALLVIDEEHRFGAKFKQTLRDMAAGLHVLAMSATPIPRTLQSVLVGVQDVSVLATPPARRRPVRTFLTPYDGGAVRTALIREKRRGGQSFLVVPRIGDIAPVQAELARLVPELSVSVAHGELPAREVDDTMVAFANGETDLLLATNIIESGLDVPRANTILVWRADRFGLSQLHQLRGRVGRGRAQAVAYLLTDPEHDISEATRARLATLEAFDRLGSGLEISARDLDLRGAGDLLGDEQAGHMRLVGVGLYQQLLARAVRSARGEADAADLRCEVRLGLSGAIPESYVPEATVRIDLYARLLRMSEAGEIDAFAEELEDRFGEPPDAASMLLALAKVALLAAKLGIAKLEGGPKALAFSFAKQPKAGAMKAMTAIEGSDWKDGRLIVSVATADGPERVEAATALLARLKP